MLTMNEIGPQAYRDAMARFAGAVHVATTDGKAGRRGTTVIAACSVSDNPATILVCVNATSEANQRFLDNGVFALNTLSTPQHEVAQAFSGMADIEPEDRFNIGRWDKLASGAPTLVDAMATFDCRLVEVKRMHTHFVLFGEVVALRTGQLIEPLLYLNRTYRSLSKI
ncbi:flavin reductase family protein [Limoniibacter endophyticus]|uniref:4-hydroxyphenylacetate 3-monooxygenase n=1 Tax=Limoniibacter endophyticus TaxID=1565040 RepID=A0A8J3GEJ1_9HYPH|nr:flavin reductase family protein [Limoniibacter endophyticus]GHC60728.1 4-hydroxyphenylacetate 3-monooxygenase [Limoniibacter endophyticus]